MPRDDEPSRYGPGDAPDKDQAKRPWLSRAGMAHAGSLLALFAVCAGAGWISAKIGMPLPWMVGPLLLTATLAVARRAPLVPVPVRWTGQMVVASAVALNMTADSVTTVVSQIGLMAVSAALLIILSGLLAVVVLRTGGADRATALFATLPGGPLEMAILANQYGGRGALVAFAQTLRIAGIVTLIPPLLILYGAEFTDITARSTELRPSGLALVLVVALATSFVFKRFGGANAFFLGPLLGVGTATWLGAPVAPIPGEVIALAQIGLGMTLGRMFDRELIVSARRFMIQAGAISLVLIAFGIGLGAMCTQLAPGSFQLYVLANAPGSITEMAVAAKGLDLDASLVTAFHMVRILVIVPFATAFYHGFARLADWLDSKGT